MVIIPTIWITAKIAVASGNNPIKTIECADVTRCSASAVSSGKPMTTPPATSASERHCPACGRGRRKSQIRPSASTPAIAPRQKVRKKGSNSCTAMRVAGSEPLKIATPIKPFIQPDMEVEARRLCTSDLFVVIVKVVDRVDSRSHNS